MPFWKRATDKEILQAEQQLGVKIPAPFVWFLKEFGSGGYWFDFIGYTKNGKAQFVEETLNQRENGLPENFLVIEDCDEFYHCLDTSNGKITSWSQYDNDGVIYRFDNFYDFLEIIWKMRQKIFNLILLHKIGGIYNGTFDKFKKKNLKSTPEEIKKIEEPKTDDRIELTLDNLYSELANTIISTLPMEWEVFHYLGEVESNKNSWSSVFL